MDSLVAIGRPALDTLVRGLADGQRHYGGQPASRAIGPGQPGLVRLEPALRLEAKLTADRSVARLLALHLPLGAHPGGGLGASRIGL